MERRQASDFDQELLDLFDEYVHGVIERREFLDKAAKFAVGGLTAAALLDMLSPDYALAKQGKTRTTRASRARPSSTPRPRGTAGSRAISCGPRAGAGAAAWSSCTRTGG